MTITRSALTGVFILICSVMFTATLQAQRADATIFGQVTDTSGAVLPGVTVTVTSPALQVQQVVAVTDERGEYRVTPLPLGAYTVEYTLAGFQSQRRDGVRLTAGFSAKLDVALAVGGVAETVTVSGASPVVDVKTTAAGTQVTREIIENVPTQRNEFRSLMTLAAGTRPQIDEGGANLTTNTEFRAFGRSGEAWTTVDGLPTASPDNADPGFQVSFNYGAVEEASVHTLGTNAEAPTSGIQINVVTKSGGNEFHGTLFAAQTFDWMQSDGNLDDRLRAQGLGGSGKYPYRWDRSGDIGGRIIRDRLWFWGGGRNRQESQEIVGAFNADGSPSAFEHNQRFVSGKITAQLTGAQQLIGSVHVKTHPRKSGPANRFAAADQLRQTNFKNVPNAQATWQWVTGNRILSVQGGDHRVRIPIPPILTQNAAWRDDVTGFQGGLEPRAGRAVTSDRWTLNSTLNWYKPDWSGNHDFKIGTMYSYANRNDVLADNGLPVGNYTLRYRSGVPSEIRIGNNPIDPKSFLGYLGLYAQDSWALNRRLTLNLGLRYANDRAWLRAQCRVAAPREFATVFPAECFPRKELGSWNPVAPRLHAAYDLTGDGRTVVKGGWGRFWAMHDRLELDVANPNARKEARYRWRDLNNNRYFDAGETNLDLNGPDFVSISIPGAAYVVEGPGGDANVSTLGLVNNPDLKEQGSDEFMISLERELIANFAMRVTGLYVREFNTQRIVNPLRPYSAYNIPVATPDPGNDNVVGTADDPGRSITYFDYPASLRGAAFESAMFVNDPNSDADFKSFEMALNKRLSNRWQMLASYSATKKHVPVPRNSAFNPNTEINSTNDTWEWLFRTSGSYQFPLDFEVSSNLLVQSGFSWARTVSATGGRQITSIILFAEPVGSRQTATQTLMALAVEKGFRIHAGQRLMVGVQVLNLLNANFDTVEPQTRGGPELGYSAEIVGPRLAEFNLRYRF